MRHRMRAAGHECDRFVARGIECPFRRFEDEDDDEEDEEDKKEQAQEKEDEGSFPQIIPAVGRRRQESDNVLVRNNVLQFSRVIGIREAMDVPERVAAFQNEGGLQFIPRGSQIASALQSDTAQMVYAALAALAVIANLGRGGSTRFAAPSLVVPQSERLVAERLSMPFDQTVRGRQEKGRRDLRKFFGFGPGAGFDAFNETGFF